jgi:hypothetical protein
VLNAGRHALPPILLTSVTTFVGLVPLMATASPATAFVIPMAVSLAFGVLFATFITLFLVPSLYAIAEDLFGWDPVAQGVTEPPARDSDPLPQRPRTGHWAAARPAAGSARMAGCRRRHGRTAPARRGRRARRAIPHAGSNVRQSWFNARLT